MIEIQVTQSDLAKVEELAGKIKNLKPFFGSVGEYLRRAHDDRWGLAESPGGERWAPLNPEYKKKKLKNKDKILILDEILRNSLFYLNTKDDLQFGTGLNYGGTHQRGNPRLNIPARPWLGLSTKDRAEIIQILIDELSF